MFSLTAYAQTVAAPTGLSVQVATNRTVNLTWTAASGVNRYNVERRVLGTTDYSTIGTVDAATIFRDTRFDPFTAYEYRVRSVAGTSQSDPTNSLTVGPPPTGFQIPAATPQKFLDAERPEDFAHKGAMILDNNEDPALAYSVYDPNFTNNEDESEIWFVRWNRAAYRWNDPVRVAVSGPQPGYLRAIALAQDRTTGVFGVIFHTGARYGLDFRISRDGGLTWQKKTDWNPADGQNTYEAPGLAMDKGRVHISYNRTYDGTFYITGLLDDDIVKWTTTPVPLNAAFSGVSAGNSTMVALDSNGIPAVVSWETADNYMLGVGYWRPGWSSSVDAIDTRNYQSDFVDLHLVFRGTNPRLVVQAIRGDGDLFDHTVWVTKSDDGGTTWQAPVLIPTDGGSHTTDAPMELGVDSKGGGAVVYAVNGSSEKHCFGPHLSRSTDLVNWTTCGLDGNDPDNMLGLTSYMQNLSLQMASNGKLYISWADYGNKVGNGVLLWREP